MISGMRILTRCTTAALAFLILLPACAQTDLEVTYIERNPKYKSYQGTGASSVLYAGKWFTDDWIDYYATYAYGLSYPPGEKHWPDEGETVTWTAHFYNRGTVVINSFDYEWSIDDVTVESGTHSTSLDPGDFGQVSILWSWQFVEKELEFSTDVSGDSHLSNNDLMVYTNSLGLMTFIDYGFAEDFRDNTPSYPGAATDSIAEWLQRHCTRMNDMFIEAGGQLRWRYDLLEFLEDTAPTPPYDGTNYDGAFPIRYTAGSGDPRNPGYYHAGEDIDYGLLHEIGHQLGIIDLYQMDVSGTANEVNGEGYYGAPSGLMHGVSPFISEHTAMAMNAWHGYRRGFFGQYLYDVPTNNNLKVLSIEGIPVPDVNVTFYEYVQTTTGKKIPNIPKFIGATNQDGIYSIPNPELIDKSLFWSDTGNELNDNPFGYVWCIGINCVFLIKMEKDGVEDYAWLDITKFNIEYWNGNTENATYEVDSVYRMAPYLSGGLDLAVLGKPYGGHLSVTKGAPPYTFTLLHGSLPPGLALNPDGSFNGIPTQRGDYPLVVQLTDSSPEPYVSEWDVTVQVIDPGLWQMYQNTKRRIGTSVVAGPTKFSTLWSVTNSSVGTMSPAVEDPHIYYGASWPSNTVWKIDMDGNKLWMADDHVGGHLNGTPAIGLDGESAGSVYIGGNYVLDVSKSNGHVNWNTTPTSYSDYIALGDNSTVYSHQWNNTMFGLRDTGTAYSVAFTGVANQDCRSPAALYEFHDEGEVMVWGGRGGRVLAVKTSDWSYLWTLHMPGTRIDLAPCVDSLNNLYFATTLYNKEFFFCVDGKTGQILWETPTGRDQIWASGGGALSLDQKTYYVQTQGNAVPLESAHDELGQLFAINTSDGSAKWTFNTKQYGWDMPGSACMVDRDGKVYVSANDVVYCIRDEGTSASLVWSIQLESANVVPKSFSTDNRGALLIGSRIDGFQGLHAIYSGFEPEEPSVFSIIRNGSGNVEISWESQSGATYRLEAAAHSSGYDPAALTWITVQEHIPSGGLTTTWEDTTTPTMAWKFYRVITEDP